MFLIVEQVKYFLTSVSLALGLITVSIPNLYKVFVVDRKKAKVDTFLRNEKLVNMERHNNTLICMKKYSKKYHDIIEKENFTVASLLVHKDWIPNKLREGKELISLDEIKLNIVSQTKKIKIPHFSFLPEKKCTYIDNLIKYKYANEEYDKTLFNGPLYCARKIYLDQDDRVNIDIYRSDYYNFMNTCKVLEIEMIYNRHGKYRHNIDLFALENRYCGIGVNCLTIIKDLKDDNNVYFLFHERSSKVAESPGLIHAVPAGSLQPTCKISGTNFLVDANEFDKQLANTVLREYFEELLSIEGMEELGSAKLMLSNEEYIKLKKNSRIYYMGIGLEPLNTKVEILATMIHSFHGEYTYDKIEELFKHKKNFEGDVKIKKFTKSMLEQFISDRHLTPSFRELLLKVYQYYDLFIS